MAKIVDRAQMTVLAAPGLGTIPLGAASSGFQTFATAGVADGDVVSYVIEDNGGLAWEIGHGTYTEAVPPTLARTEIVASSAGGTTAIDCSANAVVYIAFHADDLANIGGLPSGVAAALKIETGNAGSVVLYDGDLGTPSAGDGSNLTNITLANITGIGSIASAAATDYAATSNNLSDLGDAATARSNIGLGDCATLDVGITTGTVAAGDDSRITGAAQKTSNLSDLASASTARTNLGLGDSSVKNIGTTAGTVAAGDDSRIIGASQKASNLSDLTSAATARTNLGLATIAATGAYSDLSGAPSLATVATTGSYSDLSGKPSLAAVATSGSAADLTTGTLSAARLPTPSTTTLGGVKSASASANQFQTGIDTTGAPTFAQPAASNISGLAASATTDTTNAANISSGTLPDGRLPNPSATTLGGVKSKASTTNQFLTQIGTDGSVSAAQPAIGDISGLGTNVSTALGNAINGNSGLVQLTSVGKLPTLDGSNLTNLTPGNAGGTNGQVQYNNSGSFGGFTVSGDGTLNTTTGSLTVTKTSGVSFAASATTDATNAANISSGTLPSARISGSYTGITGVGTLAAGTWSATTIAADKGGTGQSSYTIGDILYASTASALSKLADVATGNTLISGGVGAAPSWGKVGLTTHISGTLPVANGGTGVTTSTGSGNVVLSTSPTLVTPVLGTPSSGTLTSCTGLPLSTGVTGTLAETNGGTGQSTYAVGDILYGDAANSLGKLAAVATGNALISGGVGTAPSWGKIALTTHVSGTLPVANGGTGVTSFGTGVATALGSATNAANGIIVANSSGNIVSPGTVADSTAVIRPIVAGTSVASTSGTSIDFTGIPTWVKRVSLLLSGVSLSGTSTILVQIGAGSVSATGYVSLGNAFDQANATAGVTSTTGFPIHGANASAAVSGLMSLVNISSNVWVSSHSATKGSNSACCGGGSISLGGTLDRIRITTVNGTDTFDAGTINIMYE